MTIRKSDLSQKFSMLKKPNILKNKNQYVKKVNYIGFLDKPDFWTILIVVSMHPNAFQHLYTTKKNTIQIVTVVYQKNQFFPKYCIEKKIILL